MLALSTELHSPDPLMGSFKSAFLGSCITKKMSEIFPFLPKETMWDGERGADRESGRETEIIFWILNF